MKNSIENYKDEEVIKSYYEDGKEIIALNLKGEVIGKFKNREEVESEMIKQAYKYISDLPKLESEALIKSLMAIILTCILLFGGIAALVPMAMLVIKSIAVQSLIGISVTSLIGIAGYSFYRIVYEKLIATDTKIELVNDKKKYKSFLDEIEKVKEYEAYLNTNSEISINDLDLTSSDQVKYNLKFISNHLKFLKAESELKEEQKTLRIVK